MLIKYKKIATVIALLAMIFSIIPQDWIKVYAQTPSTPVGLTDITTIASSLTNPVGLAVDKDDNVYFNDNEVISKIDVSSGTTTTAAISSSSSSIIAVGKDYALYYAENANTETSSQGDIFKIVNGIKSHVATDNCNISGIVVDSNGNIYYTSYNGGYVKKIDKDNYSNVTPINTSQINSGDPISPIGIAVDKNDNIYFAENGTGRIYKIDGNANSIITPISFNGSYSGNPWGVAVDNNNNLYVLNDDGNIYRIASDSTCTQIGTGFSNSLNISVDSSSKNVYLTDSNSVVAIKAPVITTQPSGQTTTVGQEVNLSVVATGSAISYQWKKDGVNISGENSSTLNISNAQLSNSGNYTIEISNILGTVTSSTVTLTVNAMPTAVILSNDSVTGLTAGNATITGLDSTKTYNVQIASGTDNGKYVNATGTVVTTASAITGVTSVTGLVNGTTYKVIDVTPAPPNPSENYFYNETINNGHLNLRGISIDGSNKYVVSCPSAVNGDGKVYKYTANGNATAIITGLNYPTSVATSGSAIYVVDGYTQTPKVWKYDSNGQNPVQIGTAGIGEGQYSLPYSVDLDSNGNIYITDFNLSKILKFNADGTFNKEISCGYTPFGIAVDRVNGWVYVTDLDGYTIKKYDLSLQEQTVTGAEWTDLHCPMSLTVDGTGNVFVLVTDFYAESTAQNPVTNYVKKFDLNGKLLATFGSTGTGNGQFKEDGDLAVDAQGNVFVTDVTSRIQRFSTQQTNSPSTFTLMYTAGTNGTITGNTSQTVSSGGSGVSVTAVANAGYHFVSWSDNVTTATRTDSNVSGNINVTASFAADAPVTYTLTYVAGANGTITGNTSQTVSSGGSGTSVTAVANAGYHFVSWSDGVTTASRTDSNISGNMSVTASFAVDNHSGSGGSASPSNTISGSVIDGTNDNKISNITATVTTDSKGNSTVSMNAAQAVLLKQPDGNTSQLGDISKIAITTDTGSIIATSANGTIQVQNLAKGTNNNFNITYDLGNGQKITIGKMDVKIDNNGKVSLTTTLIDPYGIITDEATGKVIDGVNVTLYYANTERNKAAGKTPDTIVPLPGIDGFKPNNNKNPQVSNANGAYGFMVFPTSDYYIVAKKDGYIQYTSPTISVEQEIVKWNFKMHALGTERLFGQDRIDTDLQIVKATFPNTVSNVILASSENYPDALAGSVLAHKLNAPILLVGSTETDQEKILSYLKDNMNLEGTVYILGGIGAVSKDMEAKVNGIGFKNITRIGGADRFETASKIADTIGVKEGTPIVIVSGENYPDALSISSIAAVNEYPIFMVNKNEIPEVVKKKISLIKPSKVYIIGSEGAVSEAVEAQAAQTAAIDKANIVRIGGADRFETSLKVIQYFGLSGNVACVASGNDFPDALAGSSYAANNNAPIILLNNSLTEEQKSYLKNAKLKAVTIFGGTGAVSKEVEEELIQIFK